MLEDIRGMIKSADDFSQKAEDTRNFTCISKANSLRRSAKEKENILSDVEQQLQEVRRTKK